jgi:5,10-methenyltetrahydrofolate synthetase
VPPPTQDDRPALRQRLRSARRALDPSLAARHADACGKALRSSAAWRQSSRVGLYLAHDGEVDARDVIAAAGVDDRALFLPRLVGQQLEFAPWQPEQALQPNRFGRHEQRQLSVSTRSMSGLFFTGTCMPTRGCAAVGDAPWLR